MVRLPERGVFVTGSSTEVGKTYVACELIRGLVKSGVGVAGYKPVASGGERVDGNLISHDAMALWVASERRGTLAEVCPQIFTAPLAPHRAAAAEGREIDADLLINGASAWSHHCEFLVVEGAGGLMSPMTDELYNIDLAIDFGYPIVVVVANRIGAINQCLQTMITAATYGDGLAVQGIILNDVDDLTDASADTNAEEIAARCHAPLMARVRHGATIEGIDWRQLGVTPATL